MAIQSGTFLSFAREVAVLAVPYLTVGVLMMFCWVTGAQARL